MVKEVKKGDLKNVILECFNRAYCYDNIAKPMIEIDSVSATIKHSKSSEIFHRNSENTRLASEKFKQLLQAHAGTYLKPTMIDYEKIIIHIGYNVVD